MKIKKDPMIENNTMINKQKPSNKQLPDKKMDKMLLQLRDLISTNNNITSSQKIVLDKKQALLKNQQSPFIQASININKKMTNINININKKIDIDSLITQSSRMLQVRKQFTTMKPITKGKIIAASQLLRQQNSMIKSYVKDKIQSQLFTTNDHFDFVTNNNNNNRNINDNIQHLYNKNNYQQQFQQHQKQSSPTSIISDKHLLRLQQQRQLLIQKKKLQHQKQIQRRQQLISQVKQFQIDSRVNVDVHEINSLIFQQERQGGYLVNDQRNNNQNNTGKQVKSQSNQLKCSALFISEVYEQHEKEIMVSRVVNNNNKNIKNNNNNIKNNNNNNNNIKNINNDNNNNKSIKNNKLNLQTKTNQSPQQNIRKQLYHQYQQQYFQQQQQEDNLQFVQVHDQIQMANKYNNMNDQYNNNDSQQIKKIKRVLNKHTNFVKVFYQFLVNQWSIVKINGQQIKLGSTMQQNYISRDKSLSLQHQQNRNTGHVWKQQKIKPIIINNKININNTTKKYNTNKNKQTISTITQNFKFKPFIINDQTKIQYEKQKISQHRVNKMIGQSSKFHVKKCILTKNQLIYYEEKQTTSQQNSNKFVQLSIPQTTKHIQLEIQRILPQVFKKEEGKFFSKKEINTQVVTVKGKARTFKFEYDFLEGKQLVGDLRKLMAAKVYALACKVNGNNNLRLLNFLYSQKMQQFNLSQSMIPIQSYLIKQDRQKHFTILIDTLVDHPQTTSISLKNTKLLPNQITLFFKHCKKLQKLTKIDLTNIRLGKQNFMQLCQFINEIKTPLNGIQVILSNCKLDDDCFMSNIGQFTSLCTKVSKLDISQNVITAKTIQVIKGCLQSATSIVRHLNINNCPIRDLSKLNSLIKQSRKLQIIQAQNCSLHFDEKRFEQMQRFFDFLKHNSYCLRKINLSKNGALTKKQFMMIQNLWYEKNIQQLVVDLDLEMVNQKGQKELLRMSNNNNLRRNLLNMKLYRKQKKNE